MSSNVYLYAGYGFRIATQGALPEPLTIPSCEHAERVGNAYCPTCGKPVKDRHYDAWSRDVNRKIKAKIESRLPAGFSTIDTGSEIVILQSRGTVVETNFAEVIPPQDNDAISELITPILVDLNLLAQAEYGCFVVTDCDE